MVGGPAAQDAIARARRLPRLREGLEFFRFLRERREPAL